MRVKEKMGSKPRIPRPDRNPGTVGRVVFWLGVRLYPFLEQYQVASPQRVEHFLIYCCSSMLRVPLLQKNDHFLRVRLKPLKFFIASFWGNLGHPILSNTDIWMFPKIGVSQNGWFIIYKGKPYEQMDDLRGSALFFGRPSPIFGRPSPILETPIS